MWLIVFGVLLCINGFYQESYLEVKDELEPLLQQGLDTFLHQGAIEPSFQEIIDKYEYRNLFAQYDIGSRAIIDCSSCIILMQTMLPNIASGSNASYVGNVLKTLCIAAHIQTEEVCIGAIDALVDAIYYVLANHLDLSKEQICGVMVQNENCGIVANISDWSINIPSGISPDRPRSNFSDSPLKIVHISDVHYDPMYQEGAPASCMEPLCCHANSNLRPNITAPGAGHWGDYRDCDTPWYAIVDAFQHIITQHPDVDYVYFTGDIIYHRGWSTSIENNTRDISAIMELLAQHFPVPVFPILGNHEPHPVDLFSSVGIVDPILATQWIYDLSFTEWGRWLPPTTRATILTGGYYSVLVKHGFRIIGLNSNVAYTSNWWLLDENIDPKGQLQWLADELLTSELNNESVHMLAHVPSNDRSCYKIWSREYRRIVERFRNTITGQFNGHSHRDEFSVYYDGKNLSEAINVVWNGASITTASNKNPSYRVYTVDPLTFDVVNNEVWCYNITEANLTPSLNPRWFKLYSFKEAYGISDLLPSGINTLVEKMANDMNLLDMYFRFLSRQADPALANGCSDTCKLNLLCDIVTNVFDDHNKCNLLIP